MTVVKMKPSVHWTRTARTIQTLHYGLKSLGIMVWFQEETKD